MAEVPADQVVEEVKEQDPPKHLALRRTIILGSLGVLTVGGAFLGFKMGQGQTNFDRSSAAGTALQDKNCINLERQRAQHGLNPSVARLGALTASQQVDCGVDWVSGMSTTYGYDASSPQGSIIKSSIDVSLPSIRTLQLDEANQNEQATHTSGTDVTSEVALTGIAGIVGFAAWMGGIYAYTKLLERQRAAAQPPAEAVAAA